LPNGEDGCWRWGKEKMKESIENGRIEFAYNGKYEAYEKIYESDINKKQKNIKVYLQI